MVLKGPSFLECRFKWSMTADKWQKCHMTFLTRMGSIANAFTLIPADLIKSDHLT